LPKGLRIFSGR